MLSTTARGVSLIGFVLACSVLQGCAYQAESFAYDGEDFPGMRVTINCVDLAIERRHSHKAGEHVFAYQFGNRCAHPALIDLATSAVFGRMAEGVAIQLAAYDPGHELRPMQLDGRAVGREAIAYTGDPGFTSVCVDAAAIAYASPARWLCFYDP